MRGMRLHAWLRTARQAEKDKVRRKVGKVYPELKQKD
jgi:hypothetical protein